MYRHRLASCALLLLSLLAGCGTRPDPGPALQSGDEVRPEIAVAPKAPWPPGARIELGLLLQVHRPGREEVTYLVDGDVPAGQAEIRGTVTFYQGDAVLGRPLEVPFVRDC